jgi:hypothetical protein
VVTATAQQHGLSVRGSETPVLLGLAAADRITERVSKKPKQRLLASAGTFSTTLRNQFDVLTDLPFTLRISALRSTLSLKLL